VVLSDLLVDRFVDRMSAARCTVMSWQSPHPGT